MEEDPNKNMDRFQPKQPKEQILRLANIIEYSNQPFVAGCSDGSIIACNQAFCNLVGYSKEELYSIPWVSLTPDDWYDKNYKLMHALAEKGFPLCYEKEYIRKDGSRIPVEIFVQRAQEKEDCQLFYTFIKEITDRKIAEKALQNERRRIFSFFDPLPVLVHLMDQDYFVVYANQYLCQQFGDVRGKKCYQIFEKRLEPCETCATYGVFKTKKPHRWEWCCQDNGKTYDLYAFPFSDYDGTPLVLELGFDITKRKQMEKEMARLDRLNLVGEMAAGLGHEIRNPMTTVRGLLQLLKGKEECKNYSGHFDLMIDELDRANSIISEFLSLARNKVTHKRNKNLNDIIHALYPLLQAEALKDGKDVKLQLVDIPDLLMDEKEIRQLILNLVKNGLEAMPSNSVLTISTDMKENQVILAVRDQGKGIAADVLEKLGTPFLTTKDEGTGLGLAMCYSIANRHDGKISVNTNASGTTFYVGFKNIGSSQ